MYLIMLLDKERGGRKMKKILVLVLALGMVLTGVVTVFADENETQMTGDQYLELRLEQIQTALEAEKITAEQAELLIQHVKDRALEGDFGDGPMFGEKGEASASCVLGENEMGIFRSESAGKRTGAGNGMSRALRDGSHQGGRGHRDSTVD